MEMNSPKNYADRIPMSYVSSITYYQSRAKLQIHNGSFLYMLDEFNSFLQVIHVSFVKLKLFLFLGKRFFWTVHITSFWMMHCLLKIYVFVAGESRFYCSSEKKGKFIFNLRVFLVVIDHLLKEEPNCFGVNLRNLSVSWNGTVDSTKGII